MIAKGIALTCFLLSVISVVAGVIILIAGPTQLSEKEIRQAQQGRNQVSAEIAQLEEEIARQRGYVSPANQKRRKELEKRANEASERRKKIDNRRIAVDKKWEKAGTWGFGNACGLIVIGLISWAISMRSKPT